MKQGRQIHYGPRDREGLLDLHVFGFYWRERGETRIRNRGAANSETNPDDSTKRPEWLGIRECKCLGCPFSWSLFSRLRVYAEQSLPAIRVFSHVTPLPSPAHTPWHSRV